MHSVESDFSFQSLLALLMVHNLLRISVKNYGIGGGQTCSSVPLTITFHLLMVLSHVNLSFCHNNN